MFDEATHRAFEKPKAGMRFHEMYSSWVYVIAVKFGIVVTRTFWGHPANPMEASIKYHVHPTIQSFRAAHSYQSIPGYTVMYCDDKAVECMAKERIVTPEEERQGFLNEV